MFQKMKKSKGFTLIEMLVVIAIIAVLVSIIVPVVGNSTAKAKAATDAANLRSAQSTLTIAILNTTDLDKIEATTTTPGNATSYQNLVGSAAPTSKSGDGDFYYTIDKNGNVTTYFGDEGKNIAYYAEIAQNGPKTESGGEDDKTSTDQ